MDNGQPPTNYNPDQSMLNGGTDVPIMKVMGGGGVEQSMGSMGGGGAPDGYNASVSLLEGGIDVPIEKVVGGGEGVEGVLDILFVKHYDTVDTDTFNTFLNVLQPPSTDLSGSKLVRLIKKYKEKNDELNSKHKFLHYVKNGTVIETSALNNSGINVQIQFIPLSTKKIIVLPHVGDVKTYFSQIQYLIQNNYMEIDEERNFKIKRHIVVISLKPFPIDTDKTLEFLYYKMKIANYNSYYLVDNPSKLIYPKDKGILFTTKETQSVPKPQGNSVSPDDFENILEQNIKSMKYRESGDNISSFHTIYGDVDNEEPTVADSYDFSLNTSIAVITLVEEDFKTITFDIQGKLYRIRIPLYKNDITSQQWEKKKYTKDEKKLIYDLQLQEIPNMNIPDFLFHISYFKCYNDVSLLTKKECSVFKTYLSILYKYHLQAKEINESAKVPGSNDFTIVRGALNTITDEVRIYYLDISGKEKFVDIAGKYKEFLKKDGIETEKVIDAVKEARRSKKIKVN
jgi:hypothetical protein